jgi:flagellar biogenesis protein FliO
MRPPRALAAVVLMACLGLPEPSSAEPRLAREAQRPAQARTRPAETRTRPPEATARPAEAPEDARETAAAEARESAPPEATPAPAPVPAPGAPPAAAPPPESRVVPAPGVEPFALGGLKLLLGAGLLALGLVLVARLSRRLPLGRLLAQPGGPIRVVARAHLGPRERLCLVEVGPTSLLLAVTAQGIQTLHAWPQGLPGQGARGAAARSGEATGGEPDAVPGQLRALQARLAAGRRG